MIVNSKVNVTCTLTQNIISSLQQKVFIVFEMIDYNVFITRMVENHYYDIGIKGQGKIFCLQHKILLYFR